MEQFLESTFLRFPHPPVKKLIYIESAQDA